MAPKLARTPSPPSAETTPSWWGWLAPVAILAAGFWAYHNSFQGPFILDDTRLIVDTPHLHHLWPLGPILTGTSRPLVNLTLALNYQLGQLHVAGYHAINLGIHLLAALVLYGVIWRSLRQRFGAGAQQLGLAVALLWVVHPLQTESVTYIIQRAESLMGLWYLLTLYGLLRGVTGYQDAGDAQPGPPAARPQATSGGVPQGRPVAEDGRPGWRSGRTRVLWWSGVSVVSCWLGMATKPVMVTAPLLALLLDRTFLSGSFRAAWRERKTYYLGLFASWMLLVFVLLQPHESVETAGFEGDIPTVLEYARTQPHVILHYLRLALWPHPLVLDYTWQPTERLSEIFWPSLGLGLLLILAVRLWRRQPAIGFWAWWTLIILAPSSSVIPIVDLAFEHRMYLPLAGILVLIAVGFHHLWHRVLACPSQRFWAAVGSVLIMIGVLGALTIRRNLDYRSEETMWRDVAKKRPRNPRALNNVGAFLAKRGEFKEAVTYYQQALKLQPDLAPTHSNLGMAFLELGNFEEATKLYQQALRLDPTYVKAYANIGRMHVIRKEWGQAMASFRKGLALAPDDAELHTSYGAGLFEQGKLEEAQSELREALRLQPEYADAYYHLGNVLAKEDHLADAETTYVRALQFKPNNPKTHNNLANVLAKQDRLREAASHYVSALQLGHPDPAEVHHNLGVTLMKAGRLEDAIRAFQQTLTLNQDHAEAHYELANLLSFQEHADQAEPHYREALRLRPDHGEAHNNFGMLLAQQDKFEEALAHFARARELMPNATAVYNNIGNTYLRQDKLDDAVASYTKALELEPNSDDAHNNLGVALLQRNDLAEAMKHFTEALRLNPDSREARANLEAANGR